MSEKGLFPGLSLSEAQTYVKFGETSTFWVDKNCEFEVRNAKGPLRENSRAGLL
jgi:hypothetical protein